MTGQPLSPLSISATSVSTPAQTRILVVKSVNNFVSGFSGVARTALYVAGPGALDMSFASYAYTKLQRPIWPLDAEAFAAP